MAGTTTALLDPGSVTDSHSRRTSLAGAFMLWGLGAYALVLAALLAVCLRHSQGHLVYVIDDPAIHLGIAQNLAHHGTWGVVPGQFQSASSSPLWTLALTVWVLAFPFASAWGPLILNLAAAVWVVVIVARNQRVLQPSRKRPLDALAAAVIVTVMLFLPGLTLVGMEHTLHTGLVLSAVVMLSRRATGEIDRWPRWLPYVLLALATLTRFETLFVTAGLVAAYVIGSLHQASPTTIRLRLVWAAKRSTAVAIATMIPFAAFAFFNRAMGQGWLPNSVLAKGQTINGAGNAFTLDQILARLASDPLLLVIVVLLVASLAAGWGSNRRSSFAAIVASVAILLHAVFAQIGWYERYQAYLVALGVVVLLHVAEEVIPVSRRAPARAKLVPALVAIAVLACGIKIELTTQAPLAVSDTYQQRVQAGKFLGRYYNGQPIATGELGYVSLQHDGPITDLYGLGDYEVLQARRRQDQRPSNDYWEKLTSERKFRVVAVYPTTLFETTPDSWVLVGEWHLDRPVVTAWEPTFQFYAADPDEVAPLEQHLREFEPELPPGVRQTLNPLAGFRADAIKATRPPP